MRSLITKLCVSGFLVIGPAVAPALAQEAQPAAKATAQVANIAVLQGPVRSGAAEGAWQTVLSNSIRTSSQKDLFVQVSLECGLYTSTLVKSKNATSDASSASASVQVRVLIDGRPAAPGEVVFARRSQELTATFQGIIDGCLTLDPLTGALVIDETCVQPEELNLLLDTMNANSFGFVLADVGTGVRVIEVQARVDLGASSQAGSAEARATIGKGSMTVEEVRMIRGEDAVSF